MLWAKPQGTQCADENKEVALFQQCYYFGVVHILRNSNSNIVIALCLQYVLKGFPRKFLELLTGTPSHLNLNQVSYHSTESTEEIA